MGQDGDAGCFVSINKQRSYNKLFEKPPGFLYVNVPPPGKHRKYPLAKKGRKIDPNNQVCGVPCSVSSFFQWCMPVWWLEGWDPSSKHTTRLDDGDSITILQVTQWSVQSDDFLVKGERQNHWREGSRLFLSTGRHKMLVLNSKFMEKKTTSFWDMM